MQIEVPPTARLVVATGRCAACDSGFVEELVWEIESLATPGGTVLIEPRHVRAGAVSPSPRP